MRPALLWVQVALLGTSLAACGSAAPAVKEESVPLATPLPQDDLPLTLTCDSPSFRHGWGDLVLKGTCPLPDGVLLKIVLTHLAEEIADGAIRLRAMGSGSRAAELKHGAFICDQRIEGPGAYIVEVSLLEE